MAEPFKEFLNAPLVTRAAEILRRVHPTFPAEAFVGDIVPQLGALELKARALCIADALERHLPADFRQATDILTRALAPVKSNPDAPMTSGEGVGEGPGEGTVEAAGDGRSGATADGLSGWILWSVGEYVSRRGVENPERTLTFLHAMTQRFTAEFAIRPLLVAHEALVLSTLRIWVNDPSPHVRRLVSEGTRPRLPWGLQLKRFIADPTPCLPLLAALMDDPSEYVRRSVANHLNDIAKDHPNLVTEWVLRHLPNANANANAPRRVLLRHASRTLIKKGHPGMLAAWGIGTPFDGTVSCTVSPKRVALGDSLDLAVTLRSTANTPQTLVVDYVVHHVKANGETSPKVFKGWSLALAPGETRVLRRRHHMKPVTTRRYYPGTHGVAIQVNGRVHAESSFALTVPSREIQ